jgi:hypothetical protein
LKCFESSGQFAYRGASPADNYGSWHCDLLFGGGRNSPSAVEKRNEVSRAMHTQDARRASICGYHRLQVYTLLTGVYRSESDAQV